MTVTAKFYVESITRRGTQNGPSALVEVQLRAVSGSSGENADWSKWTPSGECKLSITNPDAFNQFKEGQVLFLTFEPQQS